MAKAAKKISKTRPAAKATNRQKTETKEKPKTSPQKGAPKAPALHETELTRTEPCRYGVMTYLKNDAYCGRSLEKYGEYLPGEANLFRQLVRTNAYVIDIGANIGNHMLLFAQLTGSKGHVTAYEPQRITNQFLCANAAINGHFNVDTRLALPGATAGTAQLPIPDYSVEGNFSRISYGSKQLGEPIPVETIDSLNLPACHFIRVGADEIAIESLKGARATLLRHRPLIYCRNDRPDRSKALIELLFSLNYRAYWHITHFFSPDNFRNSPENIFPGLVSVNLLCVPRELNLNVGGAREVQNADEQWEKLFLKPKA